MRYEPSRPLPPPPGALNEAERPDPGFWGSDPEPRRRRRRPAARLPTQAERRAGMIVIATLAAVGSVVALRSSARPEPTASTPTRAAAVHPRHRRVIVHIAGAVARPGVVDLPAGARVIDAVEAAGGAIAAADLDRINLAAPLEDGEQVLVPLNGSPPTTAPPPTSTSMP